MRRRAYEPFLDAGLKRWIVTMAAKNLWRVTPYYDLSDLIQDGYVAYGVCLQRYGSKVENKAHFMALFKRVYWTMIIDLANKRSQESGALYVAVVNGRNSKARPYEDAISIVESARSENKVAWLAPTASEMAAGELDPAMDETSTLEIIAGGEAGEAELMLSLATAPQEIRMLVHGIQHGDFTKKHPRLKKNGRRETTNEFFNRVLDTKDFNYEQEFRALLA